MQVYFIDNDEYFKRRAVLRNENQNLFADNDERMIFFTKGVIETIKKLNWSPDIIHLHGWFTCLFPLYLNTYKDEPIFAQSKIVTSFMLKILKVFFQTNSTRKSHLTKYRRID